jgi:hypothetical protein
MFSRIFYSLNIFQTNSNVPITYYEPYYIENLIFLTPNWNITFKCEKLNKHYTCCDSNWYDYT